MSVGDRFHFTRGEVYSLDVIHVDSGLRFEIFHEPDLEGRPRELEAYYTIRPDEVSKLLSIVTGSYKRIQ